MNIKQENWYGISGTGETGYEQIRSRVAFLEREYDNLDQRERDYEISIVKQLVELIPNEASRLIWKEQINSKLEEIIKG